MSYTSITQIKAANKNLGHHFFQPATMRFFRTRIAPGVIGGRYFVTSEQFSDRSPRDYSVRRANDDGSIDTVSEFGEFTTLDAARTYARSL